MDKYEKSKVPQVRFRGFNDFWQNTNLGALCREFQSGTFIKAAEIARTGDYPVYGGNGLRGYTNSYTHDGLYALIGRQGALCGNVNLSHGKAFFTEHAIAVQADDLNDTIFAYYLMGTMSLGLLNSVQKFPDSRGKQRPIVSTPVCATIRSFGWRIWGDINGHHCRNSAPTSGQWRDHQCHSS